jgi:hypothetical protein
MHIGARACLCVIVYALTRLFLYALTAVLVCLFVRACQCAPVFVRVHVCVCVVVLSDDALHVHEHFMRLSQQFNAFLPFVCVC